MIKAEFQKGSVFIDILITLLVVSILYYLAAKSHLNRILVNKETGKMLSEQGIDTASPGALLNSIKEKLKDSQEQEERHARELEDLK